MKITNVCGIIKIIRCKIFNSKFSLLQNIRTNCLVEPRVYHSVSYSLSAMFLSLTYLQFIYYKFIYHIIVYQSSMLFIMDQSFIYLLFFYSSIHPYISMCWLILHQFNINLIHLGKRGPSTDKMSPAD